LCKNTTPVVTRGFFGDNWLTQVDCLAQVDHLTQVDYIFPDLENMSLDTLIRQIGQVLTEI